MDKVSDGIGLATKPLEPVESVITVESMTRKSAKPTVVTLLRDGIRTSWVTAAISMKSLQLKLLHSLHDCSGITSLVHGLIRQETFWLYLRSGVVILPESRW
jgi:hypothetical protein